MAEPSRPHGELPAPTPIPPTAAQILRNILAIYTDPDNPLMARQPDDVDYGRLDRLGVELAGAVHREGLSLGGIPEPPPGGNALGPMKAPLWSDARLRSHLACPNQVWLQAMRDLLATAEQRGGVSAAPPASPEESQSGDRAQSTPDAEVQRQQHLAGPTDLDSATLPQVLSAKDLAARIRQPANKVECWLRRKCKKNRMAVDSPTKGEARFLYRMAEVWPRLQVKLAEWRQAN
jgi:hypothetical protein